MLSAIRPDANARGRASRGIPVRRDRLVARGRADAGEPQTRRCRTFTIAFEDAAFDEAPDARRVAEHLGTEHTELVVTDKDALETIPKLPDLYDEPFADSSQIPTAMLAAPDARRHVTVALSGDGGDELFAGYNRYTWAQRFWHRIEPVPRPCRHVAAGALDAVPRVWWDAAFERADAVPPQVDEGADARHEDPEGRPGPRRGRSRRDLPAARLASRRPGCDGSGIRRARRPSSPSRAAGPTSNRSS